MPRRRWRPREIVRRRIMAAPEHTPVSWFAYKDEEGYWIELQGEAPCLSLWTPLLEVWERAIAHIENRKKQNVLHLRSVWFGDPIYDYIYVPPPIAFSLTPRETPGPLFLQRLRF